MDPGDSALCSREGTGFRMAQPSSDALFDAVSRAARIWRMDRKAWAGIASRGAAYDSSWTGSARRTLMHDGSDPVKGSLKRSLYTIIASRHTRQHAIRCRGSHLRPLDECRSRALSGRRIPRNHQNHRRSYGPHPADGLMSSTRVSWRAP